jgi:hypothetical protein
MAWTTDYVRRLVSQLAASSERGSSANITPEAVNLILAALRGSHRWLNAASPATAFDGFQIDAIDDQNLPLEVLATTPDEDIAHAMLAAAKKQLPARNIVLRETTSSGKIVASAGAEFTNGGWLKLRKAK